jgi:hypothetical protein
VGSPGRTRLDLGDGVSRQGRTGTNMPTSAFAESTPARRSAAAAYPDQMACACLLLNASAGARGMNRRSDRQRQSAQALPFVAKHKPAPGPVGVLDRRRSDVELREASETKAIIPVSSK